MKQLKIGAMAEACGVTPRALRLYQEAGILQPELVDEETGYRGYSIMQSVKLDMTAQLQSAGFTLREIADIASRGDVSYLREQAQRRGAELEAQIRELETARRINDELAQGCERYLNRRPSGRIMLEHVPDRTILLLDAPHDEDLGDPDIYTINERWEWYQQHAKRCLLAQGYPLALFRRVGCYVPQDQVGPNMDLLHARPFVFVEADNATGEGAAGAGMSGAGVVGAGTSGEAGRTDQDIVLLRGGTCLSVYYDTCHSDEDGADIDLDEGRVPELLRYTDEQGFSVAGPFIMENIFRWMRFFDEGNHSYFRYLLPVA